MKRSSLLMKNISLIIWMISGIATMIFTLVHLAAKDWQPATFFLLATIYADWNFHRIYNEIVEEGKSNGRSS